MNRIDRVTAILIQLQSKRIVKAREIADRFGISLRTVYRDIRTLEEAGIPLIGEAGIGYSIMDGYRLPPVMFTIEEATAFLTAEKLIEKLTDTAIEESYKSAMYKVKAVLRNKEKDFLNDIGEHIHVSKRSPVSITADNPIQVILKAINEKTVLSLQYNAKYNEKDSTRDIEPLGITFINNRWHLIAFCLLRNDYRDFRVDRINCIYPTDRKFSTEHPSLQSYLKQVADKEKVSPISILVDKKAAKYIEEQKFYFGFVSDKDLGEKTEMTFLSPSVEGFARWYLSFADQATVISGEELKKRLEIILSAIADKIKIPLPA